VEELINVVCQIAPLLLSLIRTCEQYDIIIILKGIGQNVGLLLLLLYGTLSKCRQ